ncbi:dachshund homolog 2 isoform X2 [Fundulus heteroclitus]|uniref:dachshund homolog 2 isoform X2 n=1 Tax=Fundulus heteroclitus TaxID=8078 RepID=UPI00165C385B|nr:dachshund homolog 2 isoform X2 [Fundulus heteroclitus]
MADPSKRTSTPPPDPAFPSGPLYSAPNLGRCPRLPGPSLSGRLPLGVNGASGSGAAPRAECRLVEVHGLQVASFTVDGAELICLPQVFELFLKHLVGGLHTVYTKLKRLRISPVVCTVEQVRVLRGLGAIQPGVNRCKLISRADFETLYRDCTCASSRPGRPPKRSLGLANMSDGSRLLPHALLSPALLSQTGLTAAMAEALKMHKMRLMMLRFHGNGDQQLQQSEPESENDDTGGSEGSWEKDHHLLSPASSIVAPPAGSICFSTLRQHRSLLANRLTDLPFMVMPHPLLPVGLPPASVAMAMNKMSQLSSLAHMTAVSQTEDNKDSPKGGSSLCPTPSDEDLHFQEPTSQSPSRVSSSLSSSPPPAQTPELDDSALPLPLLQPTNENALLAQPPSLNHISNSLAPLLLAEGLSSMETLLTNIQGLLKVAVESARSQSKQNQRESRELKLELDRERDVRRTVQRQLSCELETQVSMQRRLKKEKKVKRKLQEALDFESRRREQVERSLKRSDSLTDAATPGSEEEDLLQGNAAAPENRVFTKPPLLF